MSELKRVKIYSDGSALGNPGPGGYGTVLLYGDNRKELSGGFRLTTNNRMEILGAIIGLESLKTRCHVTLYSDSKYVIDAIEKGWVIRWKSNNWYRNKNEKAINVDLWERFLLAYAEHQVEFCWVKGHSGDIENERCDILAKKAANQKNSPVDPGYQEQVKVKKGNKTPKKEGESCKKCETPVIKKKSSGKNRKPDQKYYYEYYLFCPECAAMYMVEEAKRMLL